MSKRLDYIQRISGNQLLRNSSWGIVSQISQTVLLGVFFVIVARKYSTDEFGKFTVAMVLYQLISAFSSLGLSQWFIREISHTADKIHFVSRFLRMQIYFGCIFYVVNILLAYLLYQDHFIRILSLLFAVNVVFDNIITVIKSLNIAEFQQKKTFIILTLEAALKFLVVCVLLIYPFSIVTLTALLLLIRFFTLNLFVRFGSSGMVNLISIWKFKIQLADIKLLLWKNWPFVIIGGVSIVNFRIANIIISKVLTVSDVAKYEIAFKIFSIAQIIPVIISTTVFPRLVKTFVQSTREEFSSFYRRVYIFYFLFGLGSFTFIYSFTGAWLPFAFGSKYLEAVLCTQQLFLTMLIFPTAYLQANVVIAMRLEKADMWFNIALLFVNLAACYIGFSFVKSLTVINVAGFSAFFVFHLLQDFLLVKRKIISIPHVISFYVISAVMILGYIYLSRLVDNPYVLFSLYWAVIIVSILFYFLKSNLNPALGIKSYKKLNN